MALKLHFASLSMSAAVDHQTGNLSVFDIVDEIRAPQAPFAIQALAISLILERTTPGTVDGKLFIHLILPDGKTQQIGNGDLHVPNEQRLLKAVFRIGNFPIQAFGNYRFVVSWMNGTTADARKEGEAILDFTVRQVELPAGASEPPGSPITH